MENQQTKKLPLACKIIYLIFAVSVVLYIIFTQSPTFSDWFNKYISQGGRIVFSLLTSWIPFSFAELLLILLPFWFYLSIRIGFKHYGDTNRSMLTYLGIILSVVLIFGILFIWNFAAGHHGTTLDKKLDLERTSSTAHELYQASQILSEELTVLSEKITFLESGHSLMPDSYAEMNDKLLDAYERFCQKHDFINTFSSRAKTVMLSEPMSYTHITGVYTFFTGEANINIHFPDYTIPFTTAHELAHQRGIAREDEANFIAFLVCMESDDPYIRYSGALNLYEYVMSALASADYELYQKAYYKLPLTVRDERAAYSAFFEKYRDNIAADITETTNDLYLQSQGTAEGSKSYGMVVDLAVAYFRPNFQ